MRSSAFLFTKARRWPVRLLVLNNDDTRKLLMLFAGGRVVGGIAEHTRSSHSRYGSASRNTDTHDNHPLVVLQEPATYMRTLSQNEKKPPIPHIQTALLHPLHAETLQIPYASLC